MIMKVYVAIILNPDGDIFLHHVWACDVKQAQYIVGEYFRGRHMEVEIYTVYEVGERFAAAPQIIAD